jgi:hypothetical protein
MRVPREQFRSLSLEVHGILSDVPLHDVTAVDLPGEALGARFRTCERSWYARTCGLRTP